MDAATERSSHVGLISRAGGVSFMVPFVAGATALTLLQGIPFQSDVIQLLMFSLLMTAVGFTDDRIHLSPLGKGIAQLVLAVVLVSQIGGILYLPLPFLGLVSLAGWAGFVLAVFFVVAFVNMFNFMDGLNGVASGAAVVAAFACALVAAGIGQQDLFLISLCFAAGLLGFFIFNFTSGRIFMGDGGSLGAGFFMAGLALLSQRGDGGTEIGFLFIPIIFLPFIMDVAFTLMRRAKAKKKLSQAHKEHFYQRLNQAGFSHQRVALVYIVLTIVSALVAMMNRAAPLMYQWGGPLLLIFFISLLGVLYFSSDKDTN